MMRFTSGDCIALAATTISVLAFAVKEYRGGLTKVTAAAVSKSQAEQIISAVALKVNEALTAIKELEQKRQKHEIECARVQERAAASMARTAEIQAEHGRSISQLQGQMRHVATGSADKMIEYPPTT